MYDLHHHVNDVLKLRGNAFFRCLWCSHAKCKQRPFTNPTHTISYQSITPPDIKNGQVFRMDFGFMKCSGYCHKDKEGRTITSIDGFRAYLLIVDYASRYKWAFLTKTKHPPIDILSTFLSEHGNTTTTNKTIGTDQGVIYGPAFHSKQPP